MKYLIAIPVLLAASAALADETSATLAGDKYVCNPPLTVVGPIAVAGKTVPAVPRNIALYDEHGKYQDERPDSSIASGGPVIHCNEEFGLVKVTLTDGTDQWVDRAELILESNGTIQARKICVRSEVSRSADHKEAAVSGIDSAECVPDPPASTRKP